MNTFDMHSGRSQNKIRIFLKQPIIWIMLLGGVLRFAGIGYGLPHLSHPDENRQILETFGMAQEGHLLPITFIYPLLHNYTLLIAYGLVWIFGRGIGFYQTPEDLALHFLSDPTFFVILARSLSVLAGVATVFIIFRMGRMLVSNAVGTLAAFLAAVNFLLVQISQWALPDALLVLCTTAGFYFLFLGLSKRQIRYVYWASVLIGLAVSTKYRGGFFSPSLIMAALWISPKGRWLRFSGAVVLCFLLGASVGNMGWFFRTGEVWGRFIELTSAARYGVSSASIFPHQPFQYVFWFFSELVRQQNGMGILFIAGIAVSLIRRTRADVVFLVTLGVTWFILSQSSIRYLYFGVILFPLFCVFAARAIIGLYRRFAKSKASVCVAACACFLILPSITGVVQANALKHVPDTRMLAKEWIEENIPDETRIAVDWYAFSVPLQGRRPSSLEGPRDARSRRRLPETLEARYREFVDEREPYDLIFMLAPQEEPVWPKEMPAEAIDRASQNAYFRHLYSWFRFRDLNELKRLGAQVVILSSFSYSHFLLDDDPQKTPLFNPFFRENTLANNRQAFDYDPSGDEGLLFFLVKEARRCYAPFLSGEGPRLIKEFKPSREHWGPVVKIYDLKYGGSS